MSERKLRNVDLVDRLDQPIHHGDTRNIQEAFVDYLVDSKEDIDSISIDIKYLSKVLPYVQDVSERWKSVKISDLVTSHKAIKGFYDTLRNQLKSISNLKTRVTEARDELAALDEQDKQDKQDETYESHDVEQIENKKTKKPKPASPKNKVILTKRPQAIRYEEPPAMI
jgi:hypothetical protein